MSETSKITTPIVNALTKAGYFAMRLNSGKVRVRGGYIQLCPKGTADILVCPANQPPIWIETKEVRDLKRKGETATAQDDFRVMVLGLGHRHIRATSLDDVLPLLK